MINEVLLIVVAYVSGAVTPALIEFLSQYIDSDPDGHVNYNHHQTVSQILPSILWPFLVLVGIFVFITRTLKGLFKRAAAFIGRVTGWSQS